MKHAPLLERIGGGGSGSAIFRSAVHGFSFAVKVYNTDSMTPVEEEIIKKEILIMEALEHENIVTYIGHDFSLVGQIRLYMELYMRTLHGAIHARQKSKQLFLVSEMLPIALGVAKGLQYLHTMPCPIVHRDLKSENIFLVEVSQQGGSSVVTHDTIDDDDTSTSSNTSSTTSASASTATLTSTSSRVISQTLPLEKRLIAKIGDFGEAKQMTDSSKWLTTVNVGTSEFRAPEVYGKTAKGHNEKADIWSYGMVLFELLTLDIPYRGSVKSHFQIPLTIEAGIRPTLPDLPPSYADMVSLFVLCTEKDPADRPQAKEIVKRLSSKLHHAARDASAKQNKKK